MSAVGIRFTSVDPAYVPNPPAGKAFLFLDSNLQILRLKLPDGSILNLLVTDEYIQDVVGALIQNSPTIISNYDDANNALFLEIALNSITTAHVQQISPIKIGDDYNLHLQNLAVTNNNILTPIINYTLSNNGTYTFIIKCSAIRTGGITGNEGDGASFIRMARVKKWDNNITVLDIQSTYTSRDSSDLNLVIGLSAISSEIIIYVIGKAQETYKWVCDVDIHIINV